MESRRSVIASTSSAAATRRPGERVFAVDACRGFVLLMYCLSESFLPVLRALPSSPERDLIVTQFTHSEWAGYTFYDLGFPAFIMLLAMSMPLSFERRRLDGKSRGELLKRIVIRSVLLFVLGIFFHGGFSVPFPELRFTRIFHRLAIAILISGLAELTLRPRGQLMALIALLGGYWGLMEYFPVPLVGSGDYSPQGNLNYYVDRVLLGAETYFVVSTLGVAATCLCGLLAGRILLSPMSWQSRLAFYAGGGLMLVNVGLLWNVACPINKHIWTPSFVAVSTGWFALIFASFYGITDGLNWKGWANPLAVLGRHSLFTYVAVNLLPLSRYANLVAGKGLIPILGSLQPFLQAAVQVMLIWILVYWLDRRTGGANH